ncbi:MAG: methyltransferase domain-containing protein [Verrucomicrobiota bacterium]
MHQSSFDKMARFCRDYLESRWNEPLTILDLGSHDINGSYRPIFQHSRWRYLGVDLAPGKNVDVVLRDPYHWRELASEMADVVISGQTIEHTEFFWETLEEIARTLKPRGLCCIIVPSSGPEHRFPVDCWRVLSDGLYAMARYAGLETIEAHTQWENLPGYDNESNKWHESILIARKVVEPLFIKLRRRAYALCRRRLRPSAGRTETVIQVFYSTDGTYREEQSVFARVREDRWSEISITLPLGTFGAPLRIDFISTLEFIDVAELKITARSGRMVFFAANAKQFDQIDVRGDAKRIAHPDYLRLRLTGIDPQLYLPSLDSIPKDQRLELHLRLCVHFDPDAVG